jgi:hypothetical protein
MDAGLGAAVGNTWFCFRIGDESRRVLDGRENPNRDDVDGSGCEARGTCTVYFLMIFSQLFVLYNTQCNTKVGAVDCSFVSAGTL